MFDILCRLFDCCFRGQLGREIPLSKSELLLLVQHYNIEYTITDRDSGEEITGLPIEEYDSEQHDIELDGETRLVRTLSDM